MLASTVTSKRKITIPVVVRSTPGLEVGDRLMFVEVAPGRFELVAVPSQ